MICRELRKNQYQDIDYEKLAAFLESSLNASLSTDANSETTLTNGFRVVFNQKGYFDVVFNYPTAFVLDSNLAKRIEKIAISSLFPYLTVFTNSGAELVDSDSGDIHTARALRYHFKKGIFRRMIFNNWSDIQPVTYHGQQCFQLQDTYYYPWQSGSKSIAISGKSGTGKTILGIIFLEYFRKVLNFHINDLFKHGLPSDANQGGIVVIDPKLDFELYNWAKKNQVTYLTPAENDSNTAYLDRCNNHLKECVDIMHARSRELLHNPNTQFKPLIIYIDEALALVSMQSKKSIVTWESLLDQLFLMGRATNIVVIISSQNFKIGDSGSGFISSSARDQLNLKILLSSHPSVSPSEGRFLFKDEDVNSVVLNQDGNKFGIGIIEGPQADDPQSRILPFNSPIIQNFKE
ncbi:hypothetical protein [Lactobacillus iners]|uniref:hypothetical protein n=1 Tax=Lactobacillus iners TaxID=147802 RepID=UPI0001FD7E8E|nr:hypothetical protein [Lactobacillus iners]EGC80164.1 FtsK/SpoIIIE family protein [Lactobacillus iners UPII 60-B]MCT7874932.1 hypothetical protein [Lactobacillus iners]MCT7882822.1 hypothetical protein [Lactobacillus iners]MCT7887786.1 hypothetical protein [Lactobacillus iners]